MLETLLWRCPNCKTQDALYQTARLFRNDYVDCENCKAHWELIRVVGGTNHRMRLISNSQIVKEMELAQWYDQMMEDFHLEAISTPDWVDIELIGSDEEVYLQAEVLRCMASPEAISYENGSRIKPPDQIKNPFGLQPLGTGKLFFCSSHLLFIPDDKRITPLTLAWCDLRNADALLDMAVGTSFREWTFFFVLKDQSVLKWLAHFHQLVQELPEKCDHDVYLGYI